MDSFDSAKTRCRKIYDNRSLLKKVTGSRDECIFSSQLYNLDMPDYAQILQI